MGTVRLSIALLGYPLIEVTTSPPLTPVAAPTASPLAAKQPEGEAPGPVTERVANPITSIGFHARRRWADGRDQW
jgi:hypothetical protein